MSRASEQQRKENESYTATKAKVKQDENERGGKCDRRVTEKEFVSHLKIMSTALWQPTSLFKDNEQSYGVHPKDIE